MSFVHGFITLELAGHFAEVADPVADLFMPMAVAFCIGLGLDDVSVRATHEDMLALRRSAAVAAMRNRRCRALLPPGPASVRRTSSSTPRRVLSLLGDVPLAVTGGFRSRSGMDAAVISGECDVVGVGRPTSPRPKRRACSCRVRRTRWSRTTSVPACVAWWARSRTLEVSRCHHRSGWHNDQIHRLAKGLEPDLDRGALAATISMIRKNGRTSFRKKRGQ